MTTTHDDFESRLTAIEEDAWQHEPGTIRRFLSIRPDYEELCNEVEYILRKRVEQTGIQTASVTSRTKSLESFLEKSRRKGYKDPFVETTDLAGTRAVCLYASDLERLADVVRREFEVVEDIDKLGELGIDRSGYRAKHFVVKLNTTFHQRVGRGVRLK